MPAPKDPPSVGSAPFSNRKPAGRRKQRSSHEPPKTGFQPGKIYFRKTTRSFYLCCASSVYCFRVDKNGWLEHLYWGPWIDSKDDMSYLQYANVSLPFDPKPAPITAGQVISQLAHEDPSSLRAIWARAQVYNAGTDDPDSITAARIENAAWRLMQMQAHCPEQADRTRARVTELLQDSSLPGVPSGPGKGEQENPHLTISALRTITEEGGTPTSPVSPQNNSFKSEGSKHQSGSSSSVDATDPQKADYNKIAEAMGALAQPYLSRNGMESPRTTDSVEYVTEDAEELPSANPIPSVAPQVRDLRDEGEARRGVSSVVESILNPNASNLNQYSGAGDVEGPDTQTGYTTDEETLREERVSQNRGGPISAVGQIHQPRDTYGRRGRTDSVEVEKDDLNEGVHQDFIPVAGAQAVSKAHGPPRLRRVRSEGDLGNRSSAEESGKRDAGGQLPSVSKAATRSQAAAAAAGAGHYSSLHRREAAGNEMLPSETSRPSSLAPIYGAQTATEVGVDDGVSDIEHDEESVNMGVDDDGEVGRNMKLLEYSDQGTGDYRSPSFVVEYEDGSTISPLEYKNHFIHPGKMIMRTPLPCVRTDEEFDDQEATTLVITLADTFTGLEVELVYTVFRDFDVITRRSIVHNKTFLKGPMEPRDRRPPVHPFDEEEGRKSSVHSYEGRACEGSGSDWPAELAGGPGCQSEYERWEERTTSCGGSKDSPPIYYSVEASKQYHERHIPMPRDSLVEGNFAGGQSIRLSRIMSCTVDFHAGEYCMTHLSGAWAGERQMCTRRLEQGVSFVESRRGTSSHQHNPFIVVSDGSPSENSGNVYAFALIYSGNFRGEVEISESRRARVNVGLQPDLFRWALAPGESFESPEVVMAYSAAGMSQISQNLHGLFRQKVVPPEFRWNVCPVLLNTWEAMYFDVTHDKVVSLAKKAANIGIEMMVVDDGWFLGRNDDTSSLGDWFEDTSKLPLGLRGLGAELRRIGMKFGLWVEPEMVNVKSRLYRKHPNWCLQMVGRHRSEGRNQLVLDFCRPEVVEYIKQTLVRLVSDAQVDYIKWDMNRHLSEAFSAALPPSKQGEVFHRYMLGVYRVLQTLREQFPYLLIETCSGGGGRFDAGMLYYSPQIWASDNTDALARIKIQYGTSLAYPVSSIGAHISEVPNHQTLRHTSMKTRFLVALCGTFGLEMDLEPFKESELAELEYYIQLRKELAPITTFGKFYRLWSPFKFDSAAWMFVVHSSTLRQAALEGHTQPLCDESCKPTSSNPPAEQRSVARHESENSQHSGHATSNEFFARLPVVEQALVCAFSLTKETGSTLPRLRLKGLDPEKRYRVVEISPGTLRRLGTGKIVHDPANPVYQFGSPRPLVLSGKALMNAGLPVRFEFDGDSVAFKLTALQSKKRK
eukprot:gb/GECG01005518.1/.p1 GENE.gb/GECG01005518.1/~~gb/GECG01005518.1/.p1  ORF type:complete len:1395 (+),score=165.44 gb/GECG01005518.1/:1-4185(+)